MRSGIGHFFPYNNCQYKVDGKCYKKLTGSVVASYCKCLLLVFDNGQNSSLYHTGLVSLATFSNY